MATIVEKIIGTTGDYATIEAWFAACPSDLVAADQIWRGLLQNQEFVVGATILLSGKTVDATRYVELTTQAGASFLDHANKSTNALAYNAANGAAVRLTAASANTIAIQQRYTRISKLQIKAPNISSASSALVVNGTNGLYADIDKCIIDGGTTTSANGVVVLSTSVMRNCAVIQNGTTAASPIVNLTSGSTLINCTLVSVSTTLTAGIKCTYAASTLKNIYVGNVSANITGTAPTKTNCYSSFAETGFTSAPFSTATFENITAGSVDLRLKAGSVLLDAGATDATNAATDILGVARPQGASYDVGAYELPVASSPAAVMSWTEGTETVSVSGNVAIVGVAIAAAWTEGSETVSIVANSASTNGTITTPVLKNNSGSILASESGVIVNIYNITTGALIVQKTGQASSAGGIVTVSDALIVPATSYAYEVILAANGRRLPTAAAT